MDKITIETEATSAFKTLIRRNPYLSPFIDENDKTPIWDGSVFVYSKENTTGNKALLGRVPTQIKGHNTKNSFPSEIKFQMEKTNLKAFQSEGGAIFIVVYINDKYETKVYFEQFLPLDIERLFAQMKNQDSISVKFKEIPQDQIMLANLFLNFIEDRKKQMSTVDKARLHLSDWENNKDIGTYLIHISSVSSPVFNPLQALSMSTIYLYGKPDGFNLEIPLERVNNGVIQTKNAHSIGCSDKVYYPGNSTTSVWTNGNLKIKFGQAMSIDLVFTNANKINGNFHFNLVESLDNRLFDAEFILAVVKSNTININGVPLGLNLDKGTILDRTNAFYEDMKGIRKKLDELGIHQDFEFDKIDDKDKWMINLLMELNEDCEDVYLAKKNQISLFNIANIQLTIFTILKDGKLFVRDYFSENSELMFSIDTDDGQHYDTSRYLHLKENALVSSNVYAEPMYLDILKYDTWEQYHPNVNLFLLECLKAYDSGKGNHSELYKLSLLIAGWLKSKDPNSAIYTLNYFQTLVRTRMLSSDEILILHQLSMSDSENWAVKCGSLILCGEYVQAQKTLSDQAPELQDEFRSYPIYSLLKT